MLQKDASFVLMPSTQTNTAGNSNTSSALQSVFLVNSSRIRSTELRFDLHVTILLIEVTFWPQSCCLQFPLFVAENLSLNSSIHIGERMRASVKVINFEPYLVDKSARKSLYALSLSVEVLLVLYTYV